MNEFLATCQRQATASDLPFCDISSFQVSDDVIACDLWFGPPNQKSWLRLCTCLPAYLPTCLPAYLPTCLRAYLPTCLPAYLPTCLPAYLPTCLPAYLPTCLPAYLPTCLPAYLPTCLPAYLPTCLPAYLPTCLPAYLPISLSLYLSIYLVKATYPSPRLQHNLKLCINLTKTTLIHSTAKHAHPEMVSFNTNFIKNNAKVKPSTKKT